MLMLLVFAFSVTPKQWLHDLVTHHKDSPSISFNGDQSISASGFHCNCDNIVVQSPFLSFDVTNDLIHPEFFEQHQITTLSNFISSYHYNFSLRGPPSLV
ncbi:MAG: hypothetical protein ABUT20_34630 [Bacteroidota bacterium]